jgi:predicted lipid-binding transport protein (Tim44 family)
MKKGEANVMRRTGFFLAATAALALALSPGLAEARAGGGSSSGSRGAKTYTAPPATRTAPDSAQPMQRTTTPSNPTTPAAGAAAAAPSRAGSFMTGMAGGLLGVGLAGMLFGGSFFGGGMGGAGFLGLLLQIALIGGLVYLGFRLFRARQQAVPAMAGGPNVMGRDMMGEQNNRVMGGGGGGAGGALQGQGLPSIEVTPADYQQFEQILQGVQAAWTDRDVNAMRAIVTPEILTYFGEMLSEHDRRGVRNRISQVRLLSGDLAEAWAEGEREYATVAMKFGMIDVTVDATDRVVEGDPNTPTTATEVWTFLRVRGGRWVLSAIQQVG